MSLIATTGMSTPRGRRVIGIAAATLALGGLSGLATAALGIDELMATTAPIPVRADAMPVSFADIVERVNPAVVRVEVERAMRPMPMSAEDPHPERHFDEGPREHFGDHPRDRQMRRHGQPPRHGQQHGMRGVGSGFIISSDGYIVTNDHVIVGADSIRVSLDDGRSMPAEVIGRDPKTDLALLKIAADDLPVVKFATEEPRVGDWVVTIGSPFGLGQSVNAGIVSARGRDIGAGPYDDFIQIDAPINRGNSGGPAFNLDGDVVGVNAALFSPTGVNAGIGFAISATLASEIIDDLRDDGAVERGWLGVHIQPVTEAIADSLGLDGPRGAIVARVIAGGPAAMAGLRQGDVVLGVDGRAVESARDLPRLIADLDAGQSARLALWREGAEIELTVAIGEQDEAAEEAKDDPASAEDTSHALLGMRLGPLDRAARQALGVADEVEGAGVRAVAPGGPARRNGIARGDVIEKIGAMTVTSVGDVAAGIGTARAAGRESVLLLVNRGGSQRYLALPIDRGTERG